MVSHGKFEGIEFQNKRTLINTDNDVVGSTNLENVVLVFKWVLIKKLEKSFYSV